MSSSREAASSRAGRELRAQRRVLERQIAEMWARYRRTGVPSRADDFPAVVELYHYAEGVYRVRMPRDRARGFSYLGRRFGWEVTNIGRLKVIDWATRELVVSGGVDAV